MLTMQKEKVNTHFSFPMKLDMSAFVEKTLMPQQYNDDKKRREAEAEAVVVASPSASAEEIASKASAEASSSDDNKPEANPFESKFSTADEDDEFAEHYEYKLIGVTVHTGTADGGHYYSFIKERSNPNNQQQDRWFLFNDAEVKQFDPSQIEAECFGGEMTSKTYDSVTEKYLDFSFEKTNSAYMLFYERCLDQKDDEHQTNRSAETKPVADDQVPSCSTTEEPPVSATVSVATSIAVEDGSKGITADAVSTKPLSISNEQPETESNSDLAIGQNTCDIEVNKSDSNCNSIGNAVPTTSTDEKSQKLVPFRTTTPENVLSKELEEWIWEDNRFFLKDRNIFEHTYFR